MPLLFSYAITTLLRQALDITPPLIRHYIEIDIIIFHIAIIYASWCYAFIIYFLRFAADYAALILLYCRHYCRHIITLKGSHAIFATLLIFSRHYAIAIAADIADITPLCIDIIIYYDTLPRLHWHSRRLRYAVTPMISHAHWASRH